MRTNYDSADVVTPQRKFATLLVGLIVGALPPAGLGCDGNVHAIGPNGTRTVTGDSPISVTYRSADSFGGTFRFTVPAESLPADATDITITIVPIDADGEPVPGVPPGVLLEGGDLGQLPNDQAYTFPVDPDSPTGKPLKSRAAVKIEWTDENGERRSSQDKVFFGD